PADMPDRYESGYLNVPGLAGLAAAMEWLEERTVESIRQHELELTQRLLDGLSELPGVALHGPPSACRRAGVVSFTLQGYDPQEVAMLLDQEGGVQVRAGIHCAPLMHRTQGTLDNGGTVRFSPGPFNTLDQIDVAVNLVRHLATGET
ncbi:MAG: aminotransferase class V-fold PLP-dependent enzyme, partial [Pirellulales bacterium]